MSTAQTQERSRLAAVLGATMTAPWARWDTSRRDRLILDLARYQRRHMPAMRALFVAAGANTEVVETWRDLPLFPVALFKRTAVFAGGDVAREFRTRGRGGTGVGVVRHTVDGCHVASAALRSVVAELLPPGWERSRLLALYPDPRFAPASDAAMAISTLLGSVTSARSRFLGTVEEGDFASLVEELRSAEVSGPPLTLVAPTSEILTMLDRLSSVGLRFRLPPGTLVISIGGHTSGDAGLPHGAFPAACGQVLGVPSHHCVDTYKMVEFATPFLENTAFDGSDAPRYKVAPPWTRVWAVSPQTLEPLAPGEVGLLAVMDAANVDRPVALLTDDLGIALPNEEDTCVGRFLVLGRAAEAQLRASEARVDAVMRHLESGDRAA